MSSIVKKDYNLCIGNMIESMNTINADNTTMTQTSDEYIVTITVERIETDEE